MQSNSIIPYELATGLKPATPEAPAEPTWMDCPQCKQSATGKYARAFGCIRCGWIQFGFERKKNPFDGGQKH